MGIIFQYFQYLHELVRANNLGQGLPQHEPCAMSQETKPEAATTLDSQQLTKDVGMIGPCALFGCAYHPPGGKLLQAFCVVRRARLRRRWHFRSHVSVVYWYS